MAGYFQDAGRHYTGIDPGLEGAVATLSYPEVRMSVVDTPTFREKGKRLYNISHMVDIVAGLKSLDAIVCIEVQQAMPKQGVTSQFSIGHGYGLWVGMLSALRVRFFTAKPRTWQRAALSGHPGTGKARAVLRCEQLFPDVELFRPGKKKPLTGRSDAAMMAYYSYISFGVNK